VEARSKPEEYQHRHQFAGASVKLMVFPFAVPETSG
jgi:hypothetical protein